MKLTAPKATGTGLGKVRLAATKALKKMMKLGIVELEDEMIALNKALAILDQAAKED